MKEILQMYKKVLAILILVFAIVVMVGLGVSIVTLNTKGLLTFSLAFCGLYAFMGILAHVYTKLGVK